MRELGKPEKVDAGTTFMIASNTKPLTTLLMASLVDAGTLDWDTPVTKVYPAFKLGDAATTQQVLVKHLLCACTGLRGRTTTGCWVQGRDGGLGDAHARRHAADHQIRRPVPVQQPDGSGRGYVAGHAVSPGKELGAAYDEAMQARVFGPLGMKTATFDIARAERGNHARPHGIDADGKVVVASMGFNHSIFPARPAGAAWTSAATS